MSLDMMELAWEVEKEFGVTFVGAELPLSTVGAIHDYLLDWRQIALDGVCLSGAVFYRARRALCRQLDLDRRSVCPESRLEELFPMQDRRDHWDRFRQAVGPLDLPDLQRQRWLRHTLAGTSVATLIVGGVVLVALGYPLCSVLPLLLAAALLRWLLLLRLTRRLAVFIPERCGTMRDMIHHALGGDKDRAHAALRRLSEQDVWDRLCRIIGEQLGIDPTRLLPETNLVDLGF
jgi:hypothetical protein